MSIFVRFVLFWVGIVVIIMGAILVLVEFVSNAHDNLMLVVGMSLIVAGAGATFWSCTYYRRDPYKRTHRPWMRDDF